MKPVFIFMLILLVGGLVMAPMFVKGPTGDPIMTAEGWVPDPVKDVAEAVKPVNQAFRWKDADGVWQFSDTRPAGIDEQDLQIIAIAEVMTLPRVAFTGNERDQENVDGPAGSSPTAVLISKYTGSPQAQGLGPATVEDGQPSAMNDALAEIAKRFPRFKAMSDAMAQQPSAERPADLQQEP